MKHILISIFLILSLITPCYAVQINSNQVDAMIPTKSYVNGTDEIQAIAIANRYTKAETNATIEARIAAIPAVISDLVKIGEYSPSGSTSTYTISSIPTGYKILKLYIYAVTTESSAENEQMWMQLNSDTGRNYNFAVSDVSTIDGNSTASTNSKFFLCNIGSVSDASSSSNCIIDISNSIPTRSKHISVSGSSSYKSGAQNYVYRIVIGGWWANTSDEVSAATILTDGANFSASTKFILYGLK